MKNLLLSTKFSMLLMFAVIMTVISVPTFAQKQIKSGILIQSVSVTSEPAGAQVFVGDKLVCPSTPGMANIEVQGIILDANKKYREQAMEDAKKQSSVTLTFVKDGYISKSVVLEPVVSFQKIGLFKQYLFDWPKNAYVKFDVNPNGTYAHDTSIPAGEAQKTVNRDNPGQTALERTIIRWYFESAPQGARIFWRVISSVPDQVKNTNENWLGNTPFEETRSFNIQGLTYENSRDVQIEIKVRRPGYLDQTKRFNVRQAIDQQEISSFFDMIKAEE